MTDGETVIAKAGAIVVGMLALLALVVMITGAIFKEWSDQE